MKKNNSFKRNRGKPLKKQPSLNNNGFRIKGENMKNIYSSSISI